jgi:hypothetical protein
MLTPAGSRIGRGRVSAPADVNFNDLSYTRTFRLQRVAFHFGTVTDAILDYLS